MRIAWQGFPPLQQTHNETTARTKNSGTGNRTPGVCVTGRNVTNYTMPETIARHYNYKNKKKTQKQNICNQKKIKNPVVISQNTPSLPLLNPRESNKRGHWFKCTYFWDKLDSNEDYFDFRFTHSLPHGTTKVPTFGHNTVNPFAGSTVIVYVPATDETRVWFPAGAFKFFCHRKRTHPKLLHHIYIYIFFFVGGLVSVKL